MKTPTELPVIKKFDLAAPVANDVYAAVASLDYRHFNRNWRKICKTAGISHNQNVLSIAEAYALSAALSDFGGPVALLGRALNIRTDTYVAARQMIDVDDAFEPVDTGRRALETFERTRYVNPEQLRAIHNQNFYTEQNSEKLNDIAREAAETLNTEVGAVNVLLGSAMSSAGLYSNLRLSAGSPVEWSFCATTYKRENAYVVPDLARNLMQQKSPFVTVFGMAAYAGVPMFDRNGTMVGALCVLSTEVRTFDHEDVQLLEKIAKRGISEIEG